MEALLVIGIVTLVFLGIAVGLEKLLMMEVD